MLLLTFIIKWWIMSFKVLLSQIRQLLQTNILFVVYLHFNWRFAIILFKNCLIFVSLIFKIILIIEIVLAFDSQVSYIDPFLEQLK